MIEVKGLCKHFGHVKALDGVDLDIAVGKPTGLVGPNGAGKTTLFSVLCGFLNPTAGSVSIAGHPDKSALNITVAENGALKQVSMMRHQMGGGHSGLASFGYRVEEECTFGGYTIPGRIVGSWHVGTDDAYDYLDLKVEKALYY